MTDPHTAQPLHDRLRACARAICVGLSLWCSVSSAGAADALEIPASCGTQTELEREIAALREGADRRGPRPDVKLVTEGDVYVLEVRLPDGIRTLRNTDCRALFRAGIVIAALGQEGPAGSAALQAAPSGPNEVAGKQAPPQSGGGRRSEEGGRRRSHVRGVTDASSRPPSSTRGHVLATTGFTYGVVPAWGVALAAGARLSYGRWGGRMLIGYLTPRTHHQGGDGVRVDAASASLSLEAALASRAWIALGADTFLLRGRGFDVLRGRTDLALQPSLHLGLGLLLLERGRFGLELAARVLWAPRRSSFNALGHGSVYTTEGFGAQFELSLRVQFL